MSEKKKVDVKLDAELMLSAIFIAFQTVEEHEGKRPALVLLGNIGGVMFELGAYDSDRMDPADIGEEDGIYLEMDDPVIYEQLQFNFNSTGNGNDTIH